MINFLKQLIVDPKAFNYLIIVLYAASAARWAVAGDWWNVVYWLSAVGVTIAVTVK